MQPWTTIDYDLDRYPFPRLVTTALGVSDLTRLPADRQRWLRHTDQGSRWHRAFYAAFAGFEDVYCRFVSEVIAPAMGESCYYQRTPTFRVQLTDNVAVGEFHTDAQYGHPAGEVTFWLPVTPAWGTNSLVVEGHPVTASVGQVVRFDAISHRHGNDLNTTGRSRVSFDFRCLPTWRVPPCPNASVNTGWRFTPGEYYADQPMGAR